MSDSLTILFKYSVDDAIRAGRSVNNQSFIYRHDALLTSGVVFISFVGLIFYLSDEISVVRFVGAVPFSLAAAVSVGALVYLWRSIIGLWLARRKVQKLFSSSPAMCQEQIVQFSAEGVHFGNEMSASNTNWTAVIKAKEFATEFMFFSSSAKFGWFLPKSALASHEELQHLRWIIRENLGAKAVLQET